MPETVVFHSTDNHGMSWSSTVTLTCFFLSDIKGKPFITFLLQATLSLLIMKYGIFTGRYCEICREIKAEKILSRFHENGTGIRYRISLRRSFFIALYVYGFVFNFRGNQMKISVKSASVDGRNKWHWNVCFSCHLVDHCRKRFI